MNNGFIKVAAITTTIRVADVNYNKEQIKNKMNEVWVNGCKIAVFPELCLTGYTCSDLFYQQQLLNHSKEALNEIINYSKNMDTLFFIGLPLSVGGKLYNVAATINQGKLLGFITKSYLPNYGEFYEMRQFVRGPQIPRLIEYNSEKVWFGPNILFQADNISNLIVSGEICEDLWVPNPPSTKAAINGATIIVNCSASNDIIGKSDYRKTLISSQSARIISAYIYSNAGEGESTTDVVFSGHNIIAENGSILKESTRFNNEIIYSDVDIYRIISERRKNTSFIMENDELPKVLFHIDNALKYHKLDRIFSKTPFVPDNEDEKTKRCEEILMIQALGLKKRLEHTKCKTVIIGISGGLDSTLALLVTIKAFDLLKLEHKNIITVTMPCFGTTDRTYNNACILTNKLNTTLREINIEKAVKQHFTDINHDIDLHNITYENGQARERTQILMDIANQLNGMVIGTGDMSELALGWATYNGDHMSMYGVNASIPKTLVRHLVKYIADESPIDLKETLYDILDTPVSPELLPPENGEISQKTEDLVGPYELHDFFLYYMLRFTYEPNKIFRIATITFENTYTPEFILKWLKTFYYRFFSQQFKRSCLPDGPKVGTVAVSPRGDLRMPSDACVNTWINSLDSINLN